MDLNNTRWDGQFEDDEFEDIANDPRLGEWLEEMGFKPVPVYNPNALCDGWHGRWNRLSAADIKFLIAIGSSIEDVPEDNRVFQNRTNA
jgi:hypothetical protein